MLAKLRNFTQPLRETAVNAAQVLRERELLNCSVPEHHEKLFEIMVTKFFRPLFTNFALKITDKNDIAKVFSQKPLSRKLHKL